MLVFVQKITFSLFVGKSTKKLPLELKSAPMISTGVVSFQKFHENSFTTVLSNTAKLLERLALYCIATHFVDGKSVVHRASHSYMCLADYSD